MTEPTDLNAHRRKILLARMDRAQRLLALVESHSRSNLKSVIELRRFAEIMGVESEQGRDALEFAERMERGDARSLAAMRTSVANKVQTVQAELVTVRKQWRSPLAD